MSESALLTAWNRRLSMQPYALAQDDVREGCDGLTEDKTCRPFDSARNLPRKQMQDPDIDWRVHLRLSGSPFSLQFENAVSGASCALGTELAFTLLLAAFPPARFDDSRNEPNTPGGRRRAGFTFDSVLCRYSAALP